MSSIVFVAVASFTGLDSRRITVVVNGYFGTTSIVSSGYWFLGRDKPYRYWWCGRAVYHEWRIYSFASFCLSFTYPRLVCHSVSSKTPPPLSLSACQHIALHPMLCTLVCQPNVVECRPPSPWQHAGPHMKSYFRVLKKWAPFCGQLRRRGPCTSGTASYRPGMPGAAPAALCAYNGCINVKGNLAGFILREGCMLGERGGGDKSHPHNA